MKLTSTSLKNLYLRQHKSVAEIAALMNCSEHKVNYWIKQYGIPKRSISDAIYLKNNPHGDPFKVRSKLTNNELLLYGLGIGLYWGEGHKKNKNSVRLGNTDPILLRRFIDFLVKICGVKREDIGCSLQIFSDINPITAKNFWVRELKIRPEQIRGKITVIKSGRVGSYRQKSKYGVLIVQYHNKKLRNAIIEMIEEQTK